MTKTVALTGPEVEALGLMKFSCVTCRDLFPARCNEHRILVTLEDNRRPMELTITVARRAPKAMIKPSVLAFGRPIAGYDAPYEVLEADISAMLRPSDE